MTFSQLNYVMEVSRCGSINKAAAKLFVSQSNLSNSIHELEKELDIKIREGCQLVIDIGVPIEKIDSEQVLIDAVKEEIEMLLAHWESTLDEFEE